MVWTMSVPAGATRHIVMFTELSQTTGDALAATGVYDAPGAHSPLFAGIPAEELANIVNWDFGTPSSTTTTAPPASTTTVAPPTTAGARAAVAVPAFTG